MLLAAKHAIAYILLILGAAFPQCHTDKSNGGELLKCNSAGSFDQPHGEESWCSPGGLEYLYTPHHYLSGYCTNGKYVYWTDTARDADHYVDSYSPLPHVDAKSFEVISDDDGSYSKDVDHVYFEGGLIVGADANTFKSHGYYAIDNGAVYFLGIRIPTADCRTFIALNAGYGKDSAHVYKGVGLITGADPSSFVVLDGEYATDKNHVYKQGVVLDGVLPKTFSIPPTILEGKTTVSQNMYSFRPAPLHQQQTFSGQLSQDARRSDQVYSYQSRFLVSL